MVVTSPIPLFGLVDKCDVVRYVDGDDGAGGIERGAEQIVYSARKCRISIIDALDEDENMGFGNRSGQFRKVVMRYSPKIMRSDFVRIPWGTAPNVIGPVQLADGFCPIVNITTPGGAKVLTWDKDGDLTEKYEDSTEMYTVEWTGSAWRFTDSVAVLTHDFTGLTVDQNPFKLDWTTEVGAGYSVDLCTGNPTDHRIVWVMQQRDHNGKPHHTSLTIELEDVDD